MSGNLGPDDRPVQAVELRLERVRAASGSRARLAISVVAIVVFIGAGIAKPWGADTSGPDAPPVVPSIPAEADIVATPGPVAADDDQAYSVVIPFIPGPEPPVDPTLVQESLRSHAGWGIRAVVEISAGSASAPARLAEQWVAGTTNGRVDLAAGSGLVRALGVTAPSGTLVIDARVMREIDGREEWLDVSRVGGRTAGAPPLYWPARGPGGWPPAWQAGRYRFLVLTGDRLVSLGVELVAAPFGTTATAAPERLWAGSGGRGGSTGLPLDLPSGVFIGVIPSGSEAGSLGQAPISMPLGGRPTTASALAAAWLDTLAGQTGSGAAYGVSAYMPRAAVLGLVPPADMSIRRARLLRLAPASQLGGADPVDRAVATITDTGTTRRRQVVRFEEPDGRAWGAGTYLLTVEGDGPAGPEVLAYAATLLPGSARQIAQPLAATRAWARFAGQWGVAAGLGEPIESPGRLAIRFAPQLPEQTNQGGADFSRRCLEVNLVDTALPLLGISHPGDVRPDAIGLQRVYLDGSVDEPQPVAARSVLPGLSLVAAAEGTTWAPGWYRLQLAYGVGPRSLPVCVGRTTGTLLAVPADAGSRVTATGGARVP